MRRLRRAGSAGGGGYDALLVLADGGWVGGSHNRLFCSNYAPIMALIFSSMAVHVQNVSMWQ